ARLERLAEAHPCHACPERATHERWAARASRLEQQIQGVERRIRSRTETLARQFERVLGVLEDLGYVHDFSIQAKGLVLARIYGDGDLLVAEALGGDPGRSVASGGRRHRLRVRVRVAGAGSARWGDADRRERRALPA